MNAAKEQLNNMRTHTGKSNDKALANRLDEMANDRLNGLNVGEKLLLIEAANRLRK